MASDPQAKATTEKTSTRRYRTRQQTADRTGIAIKVSELESNGQKRERTDFEIPVSEYSATLYPMMFDLEKNAREMYERRLLGLMKKDKTNLEHIDRTNEIVRQWSDKIAEMKKEMEIPLPSASNNGKGFMSETNKMMEKHRKKMSRAISAMEADLGEIRQSLAKHAFSKDPYRLRCMENQPDCPICMEAFPSLANVKALPCQHLVCVGCVSEWQKQAEIGYHFKCPLCRQFDMSVSGSKPAYPNGFYTTGMREYTQVADEHPNWTTSDMATQVNRATEVPDVPSGLTRNPVVREGEIRAIEVPSSTTTPSTNVMTRTLIYPGNIEDVGEFIINVLNQRADDSMQQVLGGRLTGRNVRRRLTTSSD